VHLGRAKREIPGRGSPSAGRRSRSNRAHSLKLGPLRVDHGSEPGRSARTWRYNVRFISFGRRLGLQALSNRAISRAK
jgi:hypothetical protein